MDQNIIEQKVKYTKKVHFNFIDVLLIALILVLCFIVFFNAFGSAEESKREVMVTVLLSEESLHEINKLEKFPEKNEAVLKTDSSDVYGKLGEEYQKGSQTMKILLKVSLAEGDLESEGTKFLVGNTVHFRVGSVIVENAQVTDVMEVSENEGA